MKSLFSIFVSLLVTASIAQAASSSAVTISPEVSALLMSAQFAQVAADQLKTAAANGYSVKIASCDAWLLGAQMIVSCDLQEKASADIAGAWTMYGQIVGYVDYGPMGEVLISAAYFKPALTVTPGGASVGSN